MEEANRDDNFTHIRPNSSVKKRPPQVLLELPGGARGAKLFRTFRLDREELIEEISQDTNDLEQPMEVIAMATTHFAISEISCFHPGIGVSAL